MFKAIKFFFRFLYHFFFIDQEHGRLSHTKFFSIIGYGIWCWAFPYAVLVGSKASYDLWLVFGAVVIGNRSLNKYMEHKNGVTVDEASTWKGKANQPDSDDADSNEAPAPTPAPPAAPTATPTTTSAPAAPVDPNAVAPLAVTPLDGGAPVVPEVSDLVEERDMY